MYMMNDREFSNRKETLHGEFYENALKYPERIALIYENEKVSYKMLRLYALRAANYMWQRGVRRNDKIVVILPRGIGQVAALLGILAIGAAYVPIAMKQPLGRRKKIIENVKPALVLQDEAFLEENPWTGCIENNSKDTAYIIYTSGSSGEPKGVEMSHVAAMNTIEEILHMWNIGAEDSVLNISAFDFDLSVFDIFGLLTVGGTIVLIDEDDFRDPEVWKNLIEIYGITIWNSAPALLDMFLIMGENNHFGKLRLALVSGDWIPLYLPEKWYKVTSANSQFVALGGATEGGIWSNYYCVSKVDRLWNSIPYGQALPKQKYRITDENFVECGVDIPGELQIGGGSLAKGYINDEELTMKKFITDVKGERWYRTGDRGRRWADGTIEFLGRMDTQVKIRGHRIELGEIESVLKSISRIKEAVVVAQGDKYHKELVAFYLGEYIAESEIEDYLKIHLPDYSIPNSINRLENFPLNANGKVDRRRLAEYQKTDSVEIMEHNEVKERISLLPIDVGKYSFRDKISGVMCMGVLGHLKRDEQEKLLYKLDKNLNINVPILIELLEPKFLVAPVGSRISVATQGRLRYETYITDIKQVGMDQWTWRLTYKVFCGKNIVSTVDSLMSWNYQSVEKILNQLTKMHFRTAKLSETLLLAIKAR